MTGGPQFRKRPPTIEVVKYILLHAWDPINVAGECPDDEYDAYAAPVLAMILDQKTESDIADYLFKVETERMGLRGNAQHCHAIAAKLLAHRNIAP